MVTLFIYQVEKLLLFQVTKLKKRDIIKIGFPSVLQLNETKLDRLSVFKMISISYWNFHTIVWIEQTHPFSSLRKHTENAMSLWKKWYDTEVNVIAFDRGNEFLLLEKPVLFSLRLMVIFFLISNRHCHYNPELLIAKILYCFSGNTSKDFLM